MGKFEDRTVGGYIIKYISDKDVFDTHSGVIELPNKDSTHNLALEWNSEGVCSLDHSDYDLVIKEHETEEHYYFVDKSCHIYYSVTGFESQKRKKNSNLKITFDKETRKPIKVELI